MKPIKIIKFGGSVITKPGTESFHRMNVSRLAHELSQHHQGCIIVHGTGHVGKPPAIKYNYYKTGILLPGNTTIGTEIRHSIKNLNRQITHELTNAGIPAVSLDSEEIPLIELDSPGVQLMQSESAEIPLKETILQMISKGIVPVFSADFIPRPDGSFQVLSSDYITLVLATILQPHSVLFLTDVDGIYLNHNTPDESLMPVFTKDHLPLLHPANSKDVSGGMLKKVETALAITNHSNTCIIANGNKAGLLEDFLKDNTCFGTSIRAH